MQYGHISKKKLNINQVRGQGQMDHKMVHGTSSSQDAPSL